MNKKSSLHFWTQSAILVAIEVIMKLIGLGAVPVGPLNMSFLTVPIAVGAIVSGPAMAILLGGVFGLMSFYDALSGASVMTMTFLSISPISTFILCVGMRILMAYVTALIAGALKKLIKSEALRYPLSALACPLMNTFFFMGYICLTFYKTDYVQNLVSIKGATNPIMFVILLVGVQGLVEAITCAFVGGAAAKTADIVIAKYENR